MYDAHVADMGADHAGWARPAVVTGEGQAAFADGGCRFLKDGTSLRFVLNGVKHHERRRSHLVTIRFPRSMTGGFGVRLRAARLARGWTQVRLASRADVDRLTVGRLERGHRAPMADTVFRLEAALELTAGDLVPAWPEWEPLDIPEPGPRSRKRRRLLGLTLEEVALATGVSVATLSRFEREVGDTPSLTDVEKTTYGGRYVTPINARLASALRFDSLEDHQAFCASDR